jgi:hypothetical protein
VRGQRRLAVLAVIGAFLASALLTVATCSDSGEREDRAGIAVERR